MSMQASSLPSSVQPAVQNGHGSKSLGLRLTKVGFWFVLLVAVVFLAATNTGNNGLYLVLATMGGVLVVSHPLAAGNVRRLEFALKVPEEVFVHQPTRLALAVGNRNRWLPKFLLVCGIAQPASSSEDDRRASAPILIGYLKPGASQDVDVEFIAPRRGRWRPEGVSVSSLFPFGFFHKARRYRVPLEVIVYPEVFSPGSRQPMRAGRQGDESARRRGEGHEIYSLRTFRQGDDPRSIHWKQTARTGTMIVKEREAEESFRLSIVFDNATRDPDPKRGSERFERLVSEVATAALDVLERGFEVELVTRDEIVGFGTGWRQRRRILETLALIESVVAPSNGAALLPSSPSVPHLRLAIEDERPGGARQESEVA